MDKLDNKREKFGKNNLKGYNDFKDKIKHSDPRLRKLIAKCAEVLGPLPLQPAAKNWLRSTSASNPNSKSNE